MLQDALLESIWSKLQEVFNLRHLQVYLDQISISVTILQVRLVLQEVAVSLSLQVATGSLRQQAIAGYSQPGAGYFGDEKDEEAKQKLVSQPRHAVVNTEQGPPRDVVRSVMRYLLRQFCELLLPVLILYKQL